MENQKPGKIVRGFSMVDPEMVSQLHTDIKARGTQKQEAGNGYSYNFREIAHFNFTLPDFSQFDKEFVEFLMKDLVENATMKALEETGHLNWWTKCSSLQRLYPLLTSGDGNCLLHAASLGIWGVHDRWLTLRQAVHDLLSSKFAEQTLKRRWLWYKWLKNLEEGLDRSAAEWEEDWREVLTIADAKPRSPCQPLSTVPEGNEETSPSDEGTRQAHNSCLLRYESLEEIHIFSLAHVLRRPIIVVSDNWVYDFHGNPLSPIPFAGIYLPLECDPAECCRVPLVLAYSSSHFSPVVSTEPFNASTESVEIKSSPSHQANPSSGVQSAILLNVSSKPTDKASKATDMPKSTPNTSTATSTIHAALSSVLQVTKSTFLQAAKSLNPSSTSATTSTIHRQPIYAAIPLVDKDFGTLPLPFATDPGEDWDWLNQDKNEDIIKAKSLTNEQRMSLLKKYLDVVDIDMNKEPWSGQKKEENSSEMQDHDINSSRVCTVPVAILPCDNQASFYKDLCTRYLEKARERFEFEKETKISKHEQNPSMKCANDGCELYGTVANNYLCTKCFQLQSKSVEKFNGPHPSYEPPSYSEAVGNDQVYYPPTMAGKSSNTGKTTTLKELSVQCQAPGCTFYGTSDKMGFCSKCFLKNKK